MLFAINTLAQDETDIIEHIGDRYIIHVNALKPDKEMALMDVLLMCPELMSANGKRLSDDYEIRIDNVVLVMDDEMVLEALKADEISTIEIYLSTSVSIGGGERFGTIDIYLKEQPAATTSGKLMLEGSTRGNGKAYADKKRVHHRSSNLSEKKTEKMKIGIALVSSSVIGVIVVVK